MTLHSFFHNELVREKARNFGVYVPPPGYHQIPQPPLNFPIPPPPPLLPHSATTPSHPPTIFSDQAHTNISPDSTPVVSQILADSIKFQYSTQSTVLSVESEQIDDDEGTRLITSLDETSVIFREDDGIKREGNTIIHHGPHSVLNCFIGGVMESV